MQKRMQWKQSGYLTFGIVVIGVLIAISALFVNNDSYKTNVLSRITEIKVSEESVYGGESIIIVGNEQFAAFPYKSGNGTVESPYVIENLTITQEAYLLGLPFAIGIVNTNCHFVLRNITVAYSGSSNSLIAIGMLNVSFAMLDGVTTSQCQQSVVIHNSSNIFIENSVFHDYKFNSLFGNGGISLVNVENATIVNNTISTTVEASSMFNGLLLQNTTSCIVDGNTFIHSSLTLTGVDGNQVASNDIPDTNTVDGRLIVFRKNLVNCDIRNHIPAQDLIGNLILANCQTFTLSNMTLNHGDHPLVLAFCGDGLLSGLNLSDSGRVGLTMDGCINIKVVNCILNNNSNAGMILGVCSGCIIEGCDIRGNPKGVRFIGGTNSTVRNCIIESKGTNGVEQYSCSGITITNCTIRGMAYAVIMDTFGSQYPTATNTTIKGNEISDIKYNVLKLTNNSEISYNIFKNCTWIVIECDSANDIVANTFIGREGCDSAVVIDGSGNEVANNTFLLFEEGIIIHGSNNAARYNNFTNCTAAIVLLSVTSCTLFQNMVSGGEFDLSRLTYGIIVNGSSNDTSILLNTVMHCFIGIVVANSGGIRTVVDENLVMQCFYGIYVGENCTGDLLCRNNCTGNNLGILLFKSTNMTIIDNIIAGSTGDGIMLNAAHGNTIMSNTVNNNTGKGIYIAALSDGNIVAENTVQDNTDYAVYMTGCNNSIYLNNFVNNHGGQVQALDIGVGNVWDDGEKGNYWSDYTSRYPGALNDGIVWNTAYLIDGDTGAIDGYPLVRPYVKDPVLASLNVIDVDLVNINNLADSELSEGRSIVVKWLVSITDDVLGSVMDHYQTTGEVNNRDVRLLRMLVIVIKIVARDSHITEVCDRILSNIANL
ncbi:MAG: NosD domain-containing protein [Candidatus Sigynarchaeota archaeon]